MASQSLGRSAPPAGGEGRRGGESWPAMLRRWLVECPRCAAVWLVVGARDNDRHVCKDCGHGFVVRLTPAPADGPSGPAGASRGRE